MYLFQRAFSYIKKQKAKTVLLLVLFFIIANIVLAGLSIQNASEAAKVLTRQEIGADVIYSTNISQLNADIKNGVIDTTIKKESLEGVPLYTNFKLLLDSEYIESYDAISSYEVTSSTLSPFVYTTTETTTSTGSGGGRSKAILGTYTGSGDLSFRTFTRPEPSDFVDGVSVLLDGRFATQDEIDNGSYVVIVEETLASLNGLQVGDYLSLTPTVEGFTTNALDYEVIGIYQTTEAEDDRTASMVSSSLLTQNRMYTPFNTLKTMGYSDDQINNVLLDKGVITLNDPLNVEPYMTSIEGKLNLVYGVVSANDAVYEELAGPIDTLGQMSSVLVWIVVIAGAMILSLITALTINQRKNEIGILLAIGESKVKIVSQFIVEVVAIALIAFTLSTFSGLSIGKTISDITLASFISQNDVTETFTAGGGKQASTVTAEEIGPVEMNIQFDPFVLGQFFAAGILISIVSVAIPALYVTRFNPKQILTNNG